MAAGHSAGVFVDGAALFQDTPRASLGCDGGIGELPRLRQLLVVSFRRYKSAFAALALVATVAKTIEGPTGPVKDDHEVLSLERVKLVSGQNDGAEDRV